MGSAFRRCPGDRLEAECGLSLVDGRDVALKGAQGGGFQPTRCCEHVLELLIVIIPSPDLFHIRRGSPPLLRSSKKALSRKQWSGAGAGVAWLGILACKELLPQRQRPLPVRSPRWSSGLHGAGGV